MMAYVLPFSTEQCWLCFCESNQMRGVCLQWPYTCIQAWAWTFSLYPICHRYWAVHKPSTAAAPPPPPPPLPIKCPELWLPWFSSLAADDAVDLVVFFQIQLLPSKISFKGYPPTTVNVIRHYRTKRNMFHCGNKAHTFPSKAGMSIKQMDKNAHKGMPISS